MASEPDGRIDGDPTPEAALTVLGNETRLAILRALWDADDEPLAFSELRRRAGSPDSGQFNYHLSRLTGTFVEKTDEGYRARHAGRRVLRTALAGGDDGTAELSGHPIDGPCVVCGGTLSASYDGDQVRVGCVDCGKVQMVEELPPTAFRDRSADEVLHAFDRWTLARTRLVLEGVCPDCGGKPAPAVSGAGHAGNGPARSLRWRHVCGTCRYECDVPLWLAVLMRPHPAVVGFFHDHDVDLLSAPGWELAALGAAASVRVTGDDPVGIEVAFERGGDDLRVALDGSMAVTGVTVA